MDGDSVDNNNSQNTANPQNSQPNSRNPSKDGESIARTASKNSEAELISQKSKASSKSNKSKKSNSSKKSQVNSRQPSKDDHPNSSRTKSRESGAAGDASGSESGSGSDSESEDDQPAPAATNWWGLVSSLATEVSSAVVQGVKEEIAEIKEDIDTVASASVQAGKAASEYSKVAAKKLTEVSGQATEAGKEFLKTDMTEFRRVLNEETTETVNDVKHVSNIIGGAVSGWMSSVSTMVANSNLVNSNAGYYDDYDSSGIIIGKNKQKINFVSAFEARVHNLRTDTSTYCVEPEDESDYELWKETFDLDVQNTKTTISDLLVASQEVRSLYTKLVPSAVAHQVFWQRYFYKLDALERAERRRNALMERAGKSEEEDDEDLSWGGDSDEENPSKENSPRSSSKPKDQPTVQKEASQSTEQKSEQQPGQEQENSKAENSVKSDSPVIISNDKPSDKKSDENEEDWEKEFDIDMTEEQIKAALRLKIW